MKPKSTAIAIAALLLILFWASHYTSRSLPKRDSVAGAADRIKSWTINGRPASTGLELQAGEEFTSSVVMNATEKRNSSSPSDLPIQSMWIRFASDITDQAVQRHDNSSQFFQKYGLSRDKLTKNLRPRACKMLAPNIPGLYELQLVVQETRGESDLFYGGRIAGVIQVLVVSP